MKEVKFANQLVDFIYDSPSPFHVVSNVSKKLEKQGFIKLNLRDKWNIEKGGKYYVTKNDSALIAFVIGNGEIEDEGFRLIGAHTDSPTFRIKPNPEIVLENKYLKLNTEEYGGAIINTWLDRPLSVAGRVALKSKNSLYPEIAFYDMKKPGLIIPNLAIHMNRKVNEGVALNLQKDTLPLLSLVNEKFNKENYLISLIAESLSVKADAIADFDLFLYDYEKGCVMGLNDEFISCGKQDDLAMVHAGIEALINSKVSKATNVMICFDNEEVGSRTKQGAASPMVKNVLKRITLALNKNDEEFYRALYSSFMISADSAHAVHPNSPEKCDPSNRPVINNGPAIKVSASQSYTTDADSNTVFEMLCKNAGVPVQKFLNRSDERGGSTIGPISSSQLDIRSVDIGNPILAMHSIRELSGVMDHFYVTKAFGELYKI